MKSHILNNTQLSAEILIDWGYTRSRYDWGGTVKQVKKEGHTFISREERSDGSFGLGGVGLTNVFEWEDTSIYDKAAIADKFPLLGVGLCAKGDTLPFLFTKDYSVTPFQRIIEADNTHVSIRLNVVNFCNTMINGYNDFIKEYSIEDTKLFPMIDWDYNKDMKIIFTPKK